MSFRSADLDIVQRLVAEEVIGHLQAAQFRRLSVWYIAERYTVEQYRAALIS